MSISAIGGSGAYGQIASGKAIQSAADGAAEKTIIEGQTSQINGYDVGERNAQDGQNLLKVADGALDGVSEQLERMRELAVQARTFRVLQTIRNSIQKSCLTEALPGSISHRPRMAAARHWISAALH